MNSKALFANLCFVFLQIYIAAASDPDPVLDYCIPAPNSPPTTCKNSSLVTVNDFVYSGIKSAINFSSTGFAGNAVNSALFPGLNTLGMSFVRADFEVGGINVPHYHPRATEVAFVTEGSIYSGFVDTQNRLFAKVVEKGEVMVFPRGMLHFQLNVGKTRATILGSFDSQNPGTIRIPPAVFGTDIRVELLEKAFGLTGEELARLKKLLGPAPTPSS